MYESLAAVSESGSVSHRLRVRLAGAGAGAPAAGQPSNRDSARQSPSRSLWRSQVQMRLPSARGSLAGSVHHMRVVKPGRGKSLVRIRPLTVSVSRRPHSALAGRPLHGELEPASPDPLQSGGPAPCTCEDLAQHFDLDDIEQIDLVFRCRRT